MTDIGQPMEPGHRTLWLDPTFGAAGDMILGALLGLGASIDAVRAGLAQLDLDGWTLDSESVNRNALSATRAVVDAAEGHHHRTWSSIDARLANAGLDQTTSAGARATFRRLGEVEAAIHQVDIDDVHFHEVGAVDAIVDIVGSWLALTLLKIDEVTVGPIGLGSGTTKAAHGQLPIPAPATADLLAGVPIRSLSIEAETITPTGAALLVSMADRWGPIPTGRLTATARGAGTWDPDGHPNVVTAHLIVSEAQTPGLPERAGRATEAVQLTTNLDDVSSEVIGHVINRAMALGADDAWATPIVMKKSRPGVALTVLCPPTEVAAIERLIFTETGTLGLRVVPVEKRILDRHVETVVVDGQTVRIKVGPHGAKPEYDDLVAVAGQTGRSIRDLANEALARHLGQPVAGSENDHRHR